MGFELKKIMKWMLIVVGFLAGTFFVGIQLLQAKHIVGESLIVVLLRTLIKDSRSTNIWV